LIDRKPTAAGRKQLLQQPRKQFRMESGTGRTRQHGRPWASGTRRRTWTRDTCSACRTSGCNNRPNPDACSGKNTHATPGGSAEHVTKCTSCNTATAAFGTLPVFSNLSTANPVLIRPGHARSGSCKRNGREETDPLHGAAGSRILRQSSPISPTGTATGTAERKHTTAHHCPAAGPDAGYR